MLRATDRSPRLQLGPGTSSSPGVLERRHYPPRAEIDSICDKLMFEAHSWHVEDRADHVKRWWSSRVRVKWIQTFDYYHGDLTIMYSMEPDLETFTLLRPYNRRFTFWENRRLKQALKTFGLKRMGVDLD